MIDETFLLAKAKLTDGEIAQRKLADVTSFKGAQEFLMKTLVTDTLRKDGTTTLLLLNMTQYGSVLSDSKMTPFKLKEHTGLCSSRVVEIAFPHACWWWGSLFGDTLQRFMEAAAAFGIPVKSKRTLVAVVNTTVAVVKHLAGIVGSGDNSEVAAFMAVPPSHSRHTPTAEQCAAADRAGVTVGYLLHQLHLAKIATPAEKRAATQHRITLVTYFRNKSLAANASKADKRAAKKQGVILTTYFQNKSLAANASMDDKRAAKKQGVVLSTYFQNKSRAANASKADIRAAKKQGVVLSTYFRNKSAAANASKADIRAAAQRGVQLRSQVEVARRKQYVASEKYKCPSCGHCFVKSTGLKRHTKKEMKTKHKKNPCYISP